MKIAAGAPVTFEMLLESPVFTAMLSKRGSSAVQNRAVCPNVPRALSHYHDSAHNTGLHPNKHGPQLERATALYLLECTCEEFRLNTDQKGSSFLVNDFFNRVLKYITSYKKHY